MLDRLFNTEIAYTKQFAEIDENEEIIRFRDQHLSDMYTHNFTLIKKPTDEETLKKIIGEELEDRKRENAEFLRIEYNFPLQREVIESLPIVPRVTRYDYMGIEPQVACGLLHREDCIVKKAISQDILKDGMEVDILANQGGMGLEFATKRINRKLAVYRQSNPNFNLYVCYHGDMPVGNCEMLIQDGIAKIEDFDIIEIYQGKGFGTSVVKHLLEEAHQQSVELVYLITDSADTAKEMYTKCGFKRMAEKIELFFDLKNN